MKQELQIIGRNVLVDFIGHAKDIPAKVDTGADSSSVWVSNLQVDEEGVLSFTLFGISSKYYTGEVIKRKSYSVAIVRSSSGHEQIRYKTEMPVKISGRVVRAGFSLSDRSSNEFPILLGRKTLNKKFLVDVSTREYKKSLPRLKHGLNEELLKDPYAFHKKYHQDEK
jgi:hypothetical protein